MPAFHSSHDENFDFSENGYTSPLDLNRHLVAHPAACYFLKIESDSLCRDGILPGYTLIVDRALPPQNGSLVIAELNGELLARRLQFGKDGTILSASSPGVRPRTISADDTFSVWGVITASFRKY